MFSTCWCLHQENEVELSHQTSCGPVHFLLCFITFKLFSFLWNSHFTQNNLLLSLPPTSFQELVAPHNPILPLPTKLDNLGQGHSILFDLLICLHGWSPVKQMRDKLCSPNINSQTTFNKQIKTLFLKQNLSSHSQTETMIKQVPSSWHFKQQTWLIFTKTQFKCCPIKQTINLTPLAQSSHFSSILKHVKWSRCGENTLLTSPLLSCSSIRGVIPACGCRRSWVWVSIGTFCSSSFPSNVTCCCFLLNPKQLKFLFLHFLIDAS